MCLINTIYQLEFMEKQLDKNNIDSQSNGRNAKSIAKTVQLMQALVE